MTKYNNIIAFWIILYVILMLPLLLSKILTMKGIFNMYAIIFNLKRDKVIEMDRKGILQDLVNEIGDILESKSFYSKNDLLYIRETSEDSISTIYEVISSLSDITLFKESVEYIKAFKIEDISDFTEIVKSRGKDFCYEY